MTTTAPITEHDALHAGSADETLCFLDVRALARGLAEGSYSARELAATFLARIERIDPAVNAYVTVLADAALAAADASDARRARGEALGLLDGIPVSVKDVEPMAGVRFTMGVRAFRDHVSDFDPPHVRNLRAAGAVILGKTNTPELGHKGLTDNFVVGPTHTPHRLGYNSGGSTGGGAASVAAGMAVAAQGSDGGGSLRIPAAMTGTIGFKSSPFVIPEVRRPDGFQAALPFQLIGAVTRSVADTAIVHAALAAGRHRDPLHSPLARPVPLELRDVAAQAQGLRVGYAATLGNAPVAAAVRAAVDRAVASLPADYAVEPVAVRLEDHRELAELWVRQMSVQTAHNVELFREQLGVDILADSLPPEVVRLVELGRGMSAVEYRRDTGLRTAVYDAIEDVFDGHDLLVTPTLAVAGVPNGEFGRTVGPASLDGVEVETTIGWTLTFLFNFSGHPAISIPAGFDELGLPIGLQLVARRGEDALLLAAAQRIEAALATPSSII